ncbi:MAG: glycosyltransferase family 39 protein [Deltaproteobacteria bacterium]|nr:glycosyltransferase family 39 protein [Deltaproteobacteria bacterium]
MTKGQSIDQTEWPSACWQPRPTGWVDPVAALVLAAVYVAILLGGVGDLGYARDEGFYFHAAGTYQRWFELLWSNREQALAQVDAYWRTNSEHPALIKSLFALSHAVGHERLGLFAMEGTSFRFPAMVLSGLGVGLVYLWGARARGRLVGLIAAVSLAAIPRFFFHAHLACFDAPVVTMWTLCAYCYWRSLGRGGWLWPLAVGLSFGLALNTKHNSWFLPIVFTLHALLSLVPGMVRNLSRRQVLARAAVSLLCMAIIGPALLYATWPWLWHDPVPRFIAYAKFHLHHVYYNMEFLGRNYWQPPMPRAYAFVMTAATVPVVTLLCFVIGLGAALRRDLAAPFSWLRSTVQRWRGEGAATKPRDDAGADEPRSPERSEPPPSEPPAVSSEPVPVPDPATTLLWLLALGVQYGAWLSDTTPIFGGTKHWMTAYPFLTLFAGVGVHCAVKAARQRWQQGPLRPLLRGPALEPAVVAAVLLAPLVQAQHVHPWGLSNYNALVGGAAGGATLGLNRSFWGYTTGSVTPYLDEAAPRRARVYVHDTARPSWAMLQHDGRLRKDLRTVGTVAGADFGLYHHEKHMSGQEYQNWVAFETAVPDHIAGLDGVPVIWVYRRPGLRTKPAGQ